MSNSSHPAPETPWAEVKVEYGTRRVRCVVCGDLVHTADPDDQMPPKPCEHLLFISMWGLDYVRSDIKDAIETAFDAPDWESKRAGIISSLPSSSFVLEVEKSRPWVVAST